MLQCDGSFAFWFNKQLAELIWAGIIIGSLAVIAVLFTMGQLMLAHRRALRSRDARFNKKR